MTTAQDFIRYRKGPPKLYRVYVDFFGGIGTKKGGPRAGSPCVTAFVDLEATSMADAEEKARKLDWSDFRVISCSMVSTHYKASKHPGS